MGRKRIITYKSVIFLAVFMGLILIGSTTVGTNGFSIFSDEGPKSINTNNQAGLIPTNPASSSVIDNSSKGNSNTYPAEVDTTYYSKEAESIQLSLIDAKATKTTLILDFSLSGINLDGDFDAYSSKVCDPYITTGEKVQIVIRGYSAGDLSHITYEYELVGNSYSSLNISLDWTIGPCKSSYNDDSQPLEPITPDPLMVNSHFEFTVPVE